jgi:2-amino-4-hydroxy-6-hydroxymethyldihydropteridine diphosphokinase
VTDQPPFINAAAAGYFSPPGSSAGKRPAGPEAEAAIRLLRAVQGIEALYGRNRAGERRWGERSLDIDILLFGDAPIAAPDLSIPHPRLAERAFALRPLLDLLPEAVEPGTGRPYKEILAALPDQGVEVFTPRPRRDIL